MGRITIVVWTVGFVVFCGCHGVVGNVTGDNSNLNNCRQVPSSPEVLFEVQEPCTVELAGLAAPELRVVHVRPTGAGERVAELVL